jgi:hypothetical protein
VILGLFFFIVANAASCLGAYRLLTVVRTPEPSVNVLLFLLLRLTLISLVILAAGLTHTLTANGLGFWCSGFLALMLAFGAHRGIALPKWNGCGALICGVTLLLFVRLCAQVWFFAPHQGDAVVYHLPKIAEWVRAGGFTREMGLHSSATFPAGFELLGAWWVVFLRHDVLIEAAGAEFLLLGFAAVFALGRHLEFSPGTAWVASVIFVLSPGFHFSATSCMNDAPVAALVVASMALAAANAPLPAILMTAGIGVGIKPTYAYALPGIVLLAWLLRRQPTAATRKHPAAWALVAAGLAAGLFWYARNLLWYGNPIHPVGAPGYSESPVAVQFGPRLATFLDNVADLIGRRIYDRELAIGANVDDMAGWGSAAFACGLPGLLILLAKDSRFRRLAAAFGASLLSTLALVDHHPWTLKYVFFFPALLSLGGAWLMQTHRSVAAAGGAALVFSFLATMLSYDLPLPRLRELARQDWRERSAMAEPPGVRREAIIACCGGFTARSYGLYRPDFSRRVEYVRPKSEEEFRSELNRSGARVVYFVPATAIQNEILRASLRRGLLEPLGDSFFRVAASDSDRR